MPTSDLGYAMRGYGLNVSEEQLQECKAKVDPKKTGKLDFDDFLPVCEKYMDAPGIIEDVIMESFAVFDKDKNGLVNKNELKHVLTKMGEFMTAAEVEGLLKETEIDGDGNLKYKAFVEYLNGAYQIFTA